VENPASSASRFRHDNPSIVTSRLRHPPRFNKSTNFLASIDSRELLLSIQNPKIWQPQRFTISSTTRSPTIPSLLTSRHWPWHEIPAWSFMDAQVVDSS
jgi:hypothetical protein